MAERSPSTQSCARSGTEKGWPRRWFKWTGRDRITFQDVTMLKPSPWVNGDYPEKMGDWLAFTEETSKEAYYERACVVCGERAEGAIVFGSIRNARKTAGPGGHPRCILLAVRTCPHLMHREPNETVAWLYGGTGRGHTCRDAEAFEPYSSGEQEIDACAVPLTASELAALAKRDPLGLESAVAHA